MQSLPQSLPQSSLQPLALFDDNLPGGQHLWLHGLQHKLVCRQPADIDSTFARIEQARADGHWVALAAAYELGHALEPRLARQLSQNDAPLLTAWICERGEWLTQAQSHERIDAALATLDQHLALAGVADLKSEITHQDYLAALERIRSLIHAGDCYQVNFTWPLTGTAFGSPLALYRRLMDAQPVRHGGFVADADGAILSRSPELFVERRGTRLTCRPMKGTAPRSSDPDTLLRSDKDRAENVMIVDLIRNDLGRLAPAGGVRVETLCAIEAYPSVWQMTSTVSAEPVSADLLTIFRALFPCGSVTGAPKIRAMEIIHDLESGPRGLYCGALGWLAPDGDFSFNVPIRTLSLEPDGGFRLNLGSGVVADSAGESEWAECLLKGRFLTDLPPPFGLIETLRCEAGQSAPYPLLDGHLRRLTTSARHFGHRCDPAPVRSALLDHAKSLAPGTHRVRLELSADACLAITSQPLDTLAYPVQHIALAEERVDSTDLLLQHKTTARALYDRALRTALARGQFDALFLNERDEVAEGARSTIFMDAGNGPLRTPPLTAGVLNGVLRRQLIDRGEAIEQNFTLTDLKHASAIYAGNALRGLIPVRIVPAIREE
ncbi:MAG: aminodeoxychorismate synthase component I [Azoarcus sp.]|nr:aminodeoxychorismate synthase component I [Azoarcus sp.]